MQNANVSLNEPATLGTLFDLARFCTDAARYCSSSAPLSTASPPTPLSAYDSGSFVELANCTLEATLLLMSTQIALAVQQQDASGTAESRAAQRARRDLREMAGDLIEEFLEKAGGATAASAPESKLQDAIKAFMLRL